jgi:hypothetical protein
MGTLWSEWGSTAITFFAGSAFLGIVAHAVNTFPTPVNPYGAWLLGVIQFAVGQRVAAANTFKGLQTMATGMTTVDKAVATAVVAVEDAAKDAKGK